MIQSTPIPGLILFNAAVATQHPRQPIAQAVAVGQGEILAVGSDDDVLHLAGADTEKIDLDGRLVVPGFIDTHIHFYEWALKRQGVKLDDLTCLEDLVARVRQAAEKYPPGHWIMGQGWNETDWTEARMPTRDVLDRAVPDHPVLLWRCDLHLAAALDVGQALRRDPYAMLPFCGYHMGDYFRHWIKMQRSLSESPRVFNVNWFRKDENGKPVGLF